MHPGLRTRSAIRTQGPTTHPPPNPTKGGLFARGVKKEKREAFLKVFGVSVWKGLRPWPPELGSGRG